MPDARKLAAIAGRGKKAGAVTTIGKSPATQALSPSLSASIKSGKGGVDNQVTIAQIRQMAFSPDPADRQLLREMVAGMSPMQQNNLYLRMNAEMRDARAGVNAKGNPVAELSPEGELLEQIIWDGVDPPPEKLAAIRAIQEAGDVGGLGDVDLSNVEDLQPKGAPARPKVNAPDGVTLTEPATNLALLSGRRCPQARMALSKSRTLTFGFRVKIRLRSKRASGMSSGWPRASGLKSLIQLAIRLRADLPQM